VQKGEFRKACAKDEIGKAGAGKASEKNATSSNLFFFAIVMCGDGVCDSTNENCSNCFFDCGACGIQNSFLSLFGFGFFASFYFLELCSQLMLLLL
jgi:hypothetical protein